MSLLDRWWIYGDEIYNEEDEQKAPITKKPAEPTATEKDLREQLTLFKMSPAQIEEHVAKWKADGEEEERAREAEMKKMMAKKPKYYWVERDGDEKDDEDDGDNKKDKEKCISTERGGDAMEICEDVEEGEDVMEGIE